MSKIRDVSQLRQVFYQSAPPASAIDEEVFGIFKGGYMLGAADASAQAFNDAMADQAGAMLDDRPIRDTLIGAACTFAGGALFIGGGFLLGRLTA